MSFIQLCNGEKHVFLEPFVPYIHTIAYSLSHINRFTGHAGGYSVAQHSLLVSAQLPDELKLAGLLHDATECYLNDISSPLKKLLPDYCKIEKHYSKVIADHYNINTNHEKIKEADLKMLITEAKAFDLYLIPEEYPDVTPYDIKIKTISQRNVYMEFMNKFIEYEVMSS